MQTINLTSSLPKFTQPATTDGTTQTGTLALGNFEYGVVMENTAGNELVYSSIEFNGAYGILLWYSDANQLMGNLVNGNEDGSVIQIG